jgi:hypothetical protein
LALLQERVQPVLVPDQEKLKQLLLDLEANDFSVREKATEDLEKLGELAGDALHKALEAKPSPETQTRIEQLLGRLADITPEYIRALRALDALEQIGTRPPGKQWNESPRGRPAQSLPARRRKPWPAYRVLERKQLARRRRPSRCRGPSGTDFP